jgi:hypothetical protein
VDSLKALLTGEWQESAGMKGKLLAMGFGLATVSRAATQLVMTGEMQQDKRGASDALEDSFLVGVILVLGSPQRLKPNIRIRQICCCPLHRAISFPQISGGRSSD